MSNSKKMLSFLLAVIIIIMSVVSSGAIIISDDTVSPKVEWVYKIDKYLIEKMADASETDLIPVWVWMTDIDMEQLDKDIEIQTGISQQKLDTARAEIGCDASTMSANVEDLMSTDANVQNVVATHLEATKAQREKIANDTEVYLTAKKQLASQRYTAANTAKISKLDVSSDRIDFQSELTPSFIAFLTKSEIVETAKSADVVEIGYFSEYDEELEVEQTQARAMAENEEQTHPPTLDVSTLHTGIKEAIQHDEALEKYGVTGDGIKVLHVDGDYVRSDHITNFHLIPKPTNIVNVIQESTVAATDCNSMPFPPYRDHANLCVSYLQAFAEDVTIYSVAKQSVANHFHTGINTYKDMEYAITDLDVDLISASCNEGIDEYESSFCSKWFDAIVAIYNIPLIASAGNKISDGYTSPIAPANGYNAIAVGAYEYATNRMRDDYTYTESTTDQTRVTYKPDLVVAMDFMPSTSNPELVNFGGTSAGAPTVAAIVAMMMELDPSLKGQPEIIKAILMASCQEKAQPGETNDVLDPTESMEDGLTPKQGAGKVNALRALNIVEYHTYGYNYISASENGTVLNSINLNQQGGADNVKYPLNVSIAWLRQNILTKNDNDEYEITLGDYYNLYLSVYYNGQSSADIKTSTADNAGKQLVYISQPEWNSNYKIRAYWRNGVNDKKSRVKIGYAYSVGSFEKVLDQIEITGKTGVGQTLTANTYTNDGILMDAGELYYEWYRSSDGNSWQIINDADTNTYTLTEADLNKYFRCYVEQDYLRNYSIVKETSTRVVRYGDVDNDGVVIIEDATIIRRYLANLIELTDLQLLAADVNCDGEVNIDDVTIIQQFLAGRVPSLPYIN